MYIKKLDEWEKSGIDQKDHFAIVDPEAQSTPRVTGKITGKTYEEWKILLVHVHLL